MSSLKALRSRLGSDCYYCKRKMVFGRVPFGQKPVLLQATREHLIPRVEGGTNDPSNVVLACLACNMRQNQLWWLARSTSDKGKAKYIRIQKLVAESRPAAEDRSGSWMAGVSFGSICPEQYVLGHD